MTNDVYTPVETELGFLYGRDCIFLKNTEFYYNLNLTGSINGNLCSKKQKGRFVPYSITFKSALAISIIELDCMIDSDDWKAESCFDKVENSTWLKTLKGKVTPEHKHFSFQTYDSVFEVVCEDYELTLSDYSESF